MNRSAFIRRMAFAALATVFLDLPLPSEPDRISIDIVGWKNGEPIIAGRRAVLSYKVDDGEWREYAIGTLRADGRLEVDSPPAQKGQTVHLRARTL